MDGGLLYAGGAYGTDLKRVEAQGRLWVKHGTDLKRVVVQQGIVSRCAWYRAETGCCTLMFAVRVSLK